MHRSKQEEKPPEPACAIKTNLAWQALPGVEGLEVIKDGRYTLPAIKFTDQKTGEEKEAPARSVCFTALRVNKAKYKIEFFNYRFRFYSVE